MGTKTNNLYLQVNFPVKRGKVEVSEKQKQNTKERFALRASNTVNERVRWRQQKSYIPFMEFIHLASPSAILIREKGVQLRSKIYFWLSERRADLCM